MITVIGEALINLVLVADDNTLQARPGGKALVVAVRAAGLGHPTALMARLSGDHFGQSLRRYAADRGVDVSAAPEADEPTMIAVSAPDSDGLMPGSLYFHGTASWQAARLRDQAGSCGQPPGSAIAALRSAST
jgi:fructokinase